MGPRLLDARLGQLKVGPGGLELRLIDLTSLLAPAQSRFSGIVGQLGDA